MTALPPLPPLPPGVVADAVAALPARLRRRLDDTVHTARSWPVTRTPDGYAVRVDDETVVRVASTVATGADLTCSCLLAPRCLHRAAVASLAPILSTSEAPPAAAPAASAAEASPAAAPAAPGAPVAVVEARAAAALWDAGAAILVTGVPGAGAVPQAQLLRAAHEARALGLHRAAAAAVRVVARLRALHRDDPAFRLAELVSDLRELLYVSHRLRLGEPLRGVARREYRQAGTARLYGLCCEPVLTASGYAGVVTHLVDQSGALWQVSDVVPGGAARAAEQPATPVSVGEARLTHQQLGRAGLLVSDLRASADGRIGTGRDVRAVAASGAGWHEAPLAGLWTVRLADQIRRYHASLDLPLTERPAGHDLLFVDGVVAGVTGDGVLVDVEAEDVTLTAVAPHAAPQLPYVDNLRQLATAVDASVRLVGRPAGRRRLAAIAVSGPWLPDHIQGHADLGVDRLTRGDAPAGPAVTADWDAPEPAPLHLLQRRVERAVEGGRAAIPGDPEDGDRLRSASMPAAARLLDRLDATRRVSRDAFGQAVAMEAGELAHAWLDAAVYLAAAGRSAELDEWVPAAEENVRQ
jgi:hypothetical protein